MPFQRCLLADITDEAFEVTCRTVIGQLVACRTAESVMPCVVLLTIVQSVQRQLLMVSLHGCQHSSGWYRLCLAYALSETLPSIRAVGAAAALSTIKIAMQAAV